MIITKKQLQEIAKAALGDLYKPKYDRADMMVMGTVYRLTLAKASYNKELDSYVWDTSEAFGKTVFTVMVGDGYVQFAPEWTGHRCNHLAAIRKMEELKLI